MEASVSPGAEMARVNVATAAGVNAGRPALRRLMYRLWRSLPVPAQRLAVGILMPKVSVGVCAVVEDSAGRILVVRHLCRRQPWGLPGGFLRRGEPPASALQRELREELGVRSIVGQLIFAETDETGRHLTLYYRAFLSGSPTVDGVELGGYRYEPVHELPRLFTAPPAWIAQLEALRAA